MVFLGQAAVSPVHLRETARALASQRVTAWMESITPWPAAAAATQAVLQASHPGTATSSTASGNANAAAAEQQQPQRAPVQVKAAAEGAHSAPPSMGPDFGFGPLEQADLQAASALAVLTGEALQDARSSGASSSSDGSDDDMVPADSSPPSSGPDARSDARPASGPDSPAAGRGWLVSPPPEDLGLQHSLTRVLAALSPGALCRVLLAMAERFPGTLEALLLHALPPAAAEVLLRKLEAGPAWSIYHDGCAL